MATEKETNLTDKQKLFCNEYIKDLNGTQAAIRAGYSEKTACEQAARLLANVRVQNYLSEIMKSKNDKLIAEQDEVLQTLTMILRRQAKESVVVTLKSHKTHFDKNGKKVVKDEETPVPVEIPTKISDVNKAAELLGKRYGLFIDKFEGKVKNENQGLLKDYLEGAKNGMFTKGQTEEN